MRRIDLLSDIRDRDAQTELVPSSRSPLGRRGTKYDHARQQHSDHHLDTDDIAMGDRHMLLVWLREVPRRILDGIKHDDRGRLHSEAGPAIVWPDGWGVHSWHGVRVPAEVIDTPAESITAERITGERNAEVRRVLIERVGPERYIAMMGAQKAATDDWGTLWRAERPGDDPYLAVELVNSTPEPDGTSKRYWIRVPGTTERAGEDRCVVCEVDLAVVPTTAHQAVAWGYGVCVDHYQPVVMT